MKRHLPLGSLLLIALWLTACGSGSGDNAKTTLDFNATSAQRRAQGKSDLANEAALKRNEFASTKANTDPLLNSVGTNGTTSVTKDGEIITAAPDYNGGSDGGIKLSEALTTGALAAGAAAIASGAIDLGNLGGLIPQNKQDQKPEEEQPAEPDTFVGPPAPSDLDRRSSGTTGETQTPSGVTNATSTAEQVTLEPTQCGQDKQLADVIKAMEEMAKNLGYGVNTGGIIQ